MKNFVVGFVTGTIIVTLLFMIFWDRTHSSSLPHDEELAFNNEQVLVQTNELSSFLERFYSAVVSGNSMEAQSLVTGQALLNLQANQQRDLMPVILKDLLLTPVLILDKMMVADVSVVTQQLGKNELDLFSQRVYFTRDNGGQLKIYDLELVKPWGTMITNTHPFDKVKGQEVKKTVESYINLATNGDYQAAKQILVGTLKEKGIREMMAVQNYSLDVEVNHLELIPIGFFDSKAIVEADYITSTNVLEGLTISNKLHFFLENVLGEWKIYDIKVVERRETWM